VAFPDAAESAQGVRCVEPARGLIDAHGMEVRHLWELFGHVAVAADDTATVAEHADNAAVLPVALLLFVRQLELAEQIVAHGTDVGRLLDLRHETGPGAFFQLVQQRRLWFLVCHYDSLIAFKIPLPFSSPRRRRSPAAGTAGGPICRTALPPRAWVPRSPDEPCKGCRSPSPCPSAARRA